MWGSYPVLRAFPTPLHSSSNLESEAPRAGGRGCEESFLTLPCAPLFLPPKELVVQKGWRLPEYTVTQESGPAHRKEFTMTCRVERFVEIGNWAEGSSFSYSSPGHRQLLASLCYSPALLAESPGWLRPPSFFFALPPPRPPPADQILRCMAGPEFLFPVDIPWETLNPSVSWVESTGPVGNHNPTTLSPHAGSGTSKKLAKRNAAAKMLLRVHTVPLDARDGNEAEPDDDHFSIVSGLCGPSPVGHPPCQAGHWVLGPVTRE